MFWTDDKTHIGVIAQDVARAVPELIQYDEDSMYMRVRYVEIIPLLVNAIKELNDKDQKLRQLATNASNGGSDGIIDIRSGARRTGGEEHDVIRETKIVNDSKHVHVSTKVVSVPHEDVIALQALKDKLNQVRRLNRLVEGFNAELELQLHELRNKEAEANRRDAEIEKLIEIASRELDEVVEFIAAANIVR